MSEDLIFKILEHHGVDIENENNINLATALAEMFQTFHEEINSNN